MTAGRRRPSCRSRSSRPSRRSRPPPTSSTTSSPLVAARDELIGNHAGQPPTNGALDKLRAGDPVGAITKLQATLEYLVVAEDAGAGDLSALKDLLGLVAEAIATEAYHSAYTATLPHSPGEAGTLKTIANLIASGHALVLAGDQVSACDAFRQATAKALKLSP
jgi:hypothetical protein